VCTAGDIDSALTRSLAVSMPLPVHNLKQTPRGKTLLVYHMHAFRLHTIFLAARLSAVFAVLSV
jgi:hypothetical protein